MVPNQDLDGPRHPIRGTPRSRSARRRISAPCREIIGEERTTSGWWPPSHGILADPPLGDKMAHAQAAVGGAFGGRFAVDFERVAGSDLKIAGRRIGDGFAKTPGPGAWPKESTGTPSNGSEGRRVMKSSCVWAGSGRRRCVLPDGDVGGAGALLIEKRGSRQLGEAALTPTPSSASAL